MTIHIIGDSTASIKLDEKRPEHGWGEFLHLFLMKDVQIMNYAKNGESTKSFKDRKLFLEVTKNFKKGDYLFIQFGHNDSKVIDPEKYTQPFGTYQANLKYFVDKANEHDVTPIIFSSISRRYFVSDKKLEKHTIGLYPKAAMWFAKNHDIKHIDMYTKTHKLYTYLTDDLSKRMFMHLLPNEHPNYPLGLIDNTHLKENGAKVIASLVAESLYKSKQTKAFKHLVLKDQLYRKVDIKRQLNE